ncbi:MAG: tRNA (N6-threonylcarbamoyladenosine(37)-N6)-methyltransferase TrmO [Candidatus Hodarchaeota archaeon]
MEFRDRKFPDKICYIPIGLIHTPFESLKGIPIQFSMSEAKGKIEIFPQYAQGLKDLDGFSHVYCLYYFDMVKLPVPLQSKPFLDNVERGVFAMRTPFRPNPIGLSIYEILKVDKNLIFVNNVDTLDGTPILDIKPYIPQVDIKKNFKIGWLKGKIKRKTS